MQERFEDSPFYQMILERGHEEGREEGVRKSLLKVVEVKYPDTDLPQLAREVTARQGNQEELLGISLPLLTVLVTQRILWGE